MSGLDKTSQPAGRFEHPLRNPSAQRAEAPLELRALDGAAGERDRPPDAEALGLRVGGGRVRTGWSCGCGCGVRGGGAWSWWSRSSRSTTRWSSTRRGRCRTSRRGACPTTRRCRSRRSRGHELLVEPGDRLGPQCDRLALVVGLVPRRERPHLREAGMEGRDRGAVLRAGRHDARARRAAVAAPVLERDYLDPDATPDAVGLRITTRSGCSPRRRSGSRWRSSSSRSGSRRPPRTRRARCSAGRRPSRAR
jgi:hypothetical protein